MLRYFNNAISLHQRLSEPSKPSKLILLTVLVILGVWLYSGFFPIGTELGIFPPKEGAFLNGLMKAIVMALPLSFLVWLVWGALWAAAVALFPDEAAPRRRLAKMVAGGILSLVALARGVRSGKRSSWP